MNTISPTPSNRPIRDTQGEQAPAQGLRAPRGLERQDLRPAPDQKPHHDVSPKDSFVLGLGFAWELGYTIAGPAVLFGLGGAYLDKDVFGTSPLFLLVGLLLAFVISFSVIAAKIRMINSRMPKDLPKKKEVLKPSESAEQQLLHDLFRPPPPK